VDLHLSEITLLESQMSIELNSLQLSPTRPPGVLSMKTITTVICGITTLLIAAAWAADESGLVTVRGIHLSCDACVTDSQGSLKEVAGVSDAKADLNGRSITFKAREEKAAQAGIKALAEHGFFGKAAFGTKDLTFPDHGIKKGDKRDAITLTGVHLSCGACRKSAHEALTKLDGLSTMEIDASANTIKLAGAGMLAYEAISLLQKAGFNPKVSPPTKK
jgi:copper chaperone CopZ